ncbi:hypothetical protein DB88DRAFT_484969 [Papiliotrema laurentii]|uniref:GSKIP domain-containing protein n=1 Tax=Papiliotrema laurentii TaxID=5418 RepID=A0AAD9L7Y2_PAPLA|nr:hypothetical protein DB88DRAFT_484969 [Papiliotrema laurentii]
MSPTDNILLNPVPELTDALRTNAWGLGEGSSVVIADCFPITPEDVDSVRSEVKQSGGSKRVVGKAKVVTLEGEHLVVLLDQRGFTIESNTGVMGLPTQTYETLEALLIAISPLYVEAMTREIGRRFEGYSGAQSVAMSTEEEKAAEGGGEVWR